MMASFIQGESEDDRRVIPSLDESNWYADVPKYTNIIGAAKLTGKSKDGLSIGIVEAVTAEEKAEIDTAGGRYMKQSNLSPTISLEGCKRT